MSSTHEISRRHFMISTAPVGGALVMGFHVPSRTAQAANAPAAANTPTSPSTQGQAGSGRTGAARDQSSGETRAVVVGSVAFTLMVATGGAVLWYTARSRHVTE